MAGRFQLVVFGDQSIPYYTELQRLIAKKEDYALAAFLSESYHALRAEICGLPPSQRARFPNSSNLAELLIAQHSSPTASCALDSALVCLHQLASFIT